MPEVSEIKDTVKKYVVQNFLEGESESELTDSTPLITGGILDSISTLQLVSFLEEQFMIRFQPNEVDKDYLDTINMIANFVQSKMS